MWHAANGQNSMPALRGEVDRLFDSYFGAALGEAPRTARAFPALNVWERDDRLHVEAELPGIGASDLDISVVGQQLVIRGRRPDFQLDDGVSFHRRERGVGEFMRVVELPVEVDQGGVEAKITEGILLITLPKAEQAKPRKIEVKS